MPLDGNLAVYLDPLEVLGIVPLEKEFVDKYKKDYRDAYLRQIGLIDHWAIMWNSISFDTWKAYRYRRFWQREQTVAQFLASPTRTRVTDDKTAAPPVLIDLATRVAAAVPDAKFTVEYFYTDPILRVTYKAVDGSKTAYLGIWEDGVVKHIASHPERVRAPWWRWL